MAGVRAIEGVDNTLVNVATAAVASLTPRPAITVGPLDRLEDELRLNWFLYSVQPNAAYSNMEPPRTGVRTAFGEPPLALDLGYVLTAHPGTLTAAGQQAQFANRGMAAVMQALHEQPIIPEGAPVLAAEASPLVEPIRVTMEGFDLDSLSKVWTSASRPLRTTVAYRVSLVVVDSTRIHVAGPPVRERRLTTVPSMGPRFGSIAPSRVAATIPLVVELLGATGVTRFTLRRERGDPAGPGAWPLLATEVGRSRFELAVAPPQLVPGPRQLEVAAEVDGLPAGGDRAAVTIVPVVTGPATTVAAGDTLSFATAHVGADVEVFLGGARLDPAAVMFVSPVQVDVTIPPTTPPGPRSLALRSAQTAGPTFDGVVIS